MPHQQVRHPRVTRPSATRTRRYAFDLHVLGTPPAFTLSQDQTLHHDLLLMPSLSLSVGPSLLQKDPQKGIKMQLVLHLRRSCSHLALLFLLFLWHVYPQKTIRPNNCLEKCLCSTLLLFRCLGPENHLVEGIKNPEGRRGTSGLRLGTSYVPVRRCLRSSMLPLSRLIDGRGC